mmetsp:Transcript_130174/g.296842  ORF Transcript_130174/g.296842 Transcript_130174/m.296842 type:complete len:582 (+) Transcript_130174:31-1776(+)
MSDGDTRPGYAAMLREKLNSLERKRDEEVVPMGQIQDDLAARSRTQDLLRQKLPQRDSEAHADAWQLAGGPPEVAGALSSFVSKIDDLLTAYQRQQLELWREEQASIQNKMNVADEEYGHIEEAVRAKYEGFIREVAGQHKREKQKLQDEVELHLIQQEQALQSEVHRMQQECAQFEENVRRKYEELLAANSKQRQADAQKSFEKSLENLSVKSSGEREVAERLSSVASAAEDKAFQKYTRILDERRQEWKQDEEARIERARREAHGQYEQQISSLEAQLDLAKKATTDSDEKWVLELRGMLDKQIAANQSHDQELRARHDRELEELRERCQEQVDFLKSEIERLTKDGDEEKQQLNAKVRKMKIALSKWRHDYLQAAQQHYDESVRKVEEQYRDQIHRMQAEITRLRDQERHAQHALAGPSHSSSRASFGPGVVSLVPPELKAANEKLGYLRQTLHRLWDALEVPTVDIRVFLLKAEQALGNVEQLLAVYDAECQHLADRLPLMQSITRREYLKKRLLTGVLDDHEYLSEQSMRQEIQMLDNQLSMALRQYERKYHQSFLYEGRNYIDTLLDDAKDGLSG